MRTRLRRLRADDFTHMRVLEGDPEIMKFTSMLMPLSAEQTRERLERDLKNPDVWVGELNDGTFIGWFMLKPCADNCYELGFMIVPALQHRGLTTEIAGKLVALAKEQDPSARFIARTRFDNHASMRVLAKLGFERTHSDDAALHLFKLN